MCSDTPAGTSGCTADSSVESSVPLAIILPTVLGSFAVLMLLGWQGWRRFRREHSTLSEKLLATEQEMEFYELEVEQYRQTWHIAASEIRLMECIGRGAVGEVFHGVWRDMAGLGMAWRDMAVARHGGGRQDAARILCGATWRWPSRRCKDPG